MAVGGTGGRLGGSERGRRSLESRRESGGVEFTSGGKVGGRSVGGELSRRRSMCTLLARCLPLLARCLHAVYVLHVRCMCTACALHALHVHCVCTARRALRRGRLQRGQPTGRMWTIRTKRS